QTRPSSNCGGCKLLNRFGDQDNLFYRAEIRSEVRYWHKAEDGHEAAGIHWSCYLRRGTDMADSCLRTASRETHPSRISRAGTHNPSADRSLSGVFFATGKERFSRRTKHYR